MPIVKNAVKAMESAMTKEQVRRARSKLRGPAGSARPGGSWRAGDSLNKMSLIAVIRDPAEIRTIIACLDKHGRGPPDEC